MRNPKVYILCALLILTGFAKAKVQWSEQARDLDYLGLATTLHPAFMSEELDIVRIGLGLETLPDIVIASQPDMIFDPETQQILFPFSAFYRSFDGLHLRFPQQQSMRESIFATTAYFLLLSKMVEALASNLELEISGWPEERFDALVTIILLNSDAIEGTYLLDAAEEFLILDRTRAAFQGDRFKNEFEEDEYRLRQILCLISGYEASVVLEDPALASEDVVTYTKCRELYEASQEYWLDLLKDRLKAETKLFRVLSVRP